MSNGPGFAKKENTVQIDLATSFAKLPTAGGSAIDRYYGRAEYLIRRTQKAEIDKEHELIPLLFLRLVSATEAYFREILCSLPRVCPLVRTHSATASVPLGAVLYYQVSALALAAFEHSSLCSEGELAKQTKKMTNFACDSDASLREAIKLFEKISQLRHAVVHAFDEIYFLNITKLEVETPEKAQVVSINPLGFQSFVGVCHSVVRAYNRSTSEWILTQWKARGVLKGIWGKDKSRFLSFYRLYFSEIDKVDPRPPKDIYLSLI